MADTRVQVIKVTELPVLAANNKIERQVQITFMVGNHGPFTEMATRAELANGAAILRVNAFAAAIGTLPQDQGV